MKMRKRVGELESRCSARAKRFPNRAKRTEWLTVFHEFAAGHLTAVFPLSVITALKYS